MRAQTNPKTVVHIRRGSLDRDTQGRKPCKDGSRDGSVASVNQGMPVIASSY